LENSSVKISHNYCTVHRVHLSARRLGWGAQKRSHRQLAMPKTAEPWSLTSLRENLIKIGAKVVRHGRYVTFQSAEVAVSRQMFQEILSHIGRLRGSPAPA
jgi:Transposase DDE domain group 1